MEFAIIFLYVFTALSWLYIGLKSIAQFSYTTPLKGHPDYVIRRRVFHHMKQPTEDLAARITGTQNGTLSVDDEDLIWFIGTRIVGPSTQPYKEKKLSQLNKKYFEEGRGNFVIKVLKGKVNGYFLDLGSGDGSTFSNTLYLEKTRNWTGLLVEPHTKKYKNALGFRRKAMSLNACASAGNITRYQALFVQDNIPRIIGDWPPESEQQRLRSERVECFPLPSILSAVDIQHVDYFSLDVAGMELDVIKTFPFGAVTIDVITVTFQPHYMSKANSKQYLAEIKLFMEGVGLHDCLGELKAQTGGGRQEGMVVTFVRKGLFKE